MIRAGWVGRLAIGAMAAAGAVSPINGQTDAAPPHTEPAILPAVQIAPAADETATDPETLGLEDQKERLSVEVKIDGQGPYDFVVDTGAERTVISRELADKLALKPGGDVTVHSMVGTSLVRTAVIPSLLVSKRPINGIHAPALSAQHIGAAGMLGTDTLEKQRVLLDFANKKMTISRSSSATARIDPNAIVVTGRSRYGRLIIADAKAEGEKVIVVIDTGSDVTVGNEALRRKLGGKKKLDKAVPITLISVLGQSASADYTRLKRISIGGVMLKNMPVAFSEVQLFRQLRLSDQPALLLGMDTLQLFQQVSIDFSTKKVQFLSPDLVGGISSRIRVASR